MSMLTIAIPSHYSQIVTKQQTVSASSTVLTALAASDAIKGRPDNIFVQALAANTGKVYINLGTATIGGAGIELVPGSNINLPGNLVSSWQVIGTASDKLNIIYQAGPS